MFISSEMLKDQDLMFGWIEKIYYKQWFFKDVSYYYFIHLCSYNIGC